jgi:hypothetical protein
LSIGAEAIFQVVYSVGSWMLRSHNQHQEIKEKKVIPVSIFVIGGFAVGMAIMYVTGLLV